MVIYKGYIGFRLWGLDIFPVLMENTRTRNLQDTRNLEGRVFFGGNWGFPGIGVPFRVP